MNFLAPVLLGMEMQNMFKNISQAGPRALPASAGQFGNMALVVLCLGAVTIGLVGSCNTRALPWSSAFAATNAAGDAGQTYLSSWQKKAYSRTLPNDPDLLLKLTGAEIASLFAAPSLERKDLPSIVWQYAAGDCVLDIYFVSEQGRADAAKAAHYELRTRDGGKPETFNACIETVIAAAADQSGVQVALAE